MMAKVKTQSLIGVLRLLGLTLIFSTAPQAYAQSFEEVAPGSAHICALDSGGQVACTSSPITTRLLPPDDLPLLRQISAGQQHTCGVTLDDTIECWGANAFGVLEVPEFDAPVQSVSAGLNHNCAVDINNEVQCWGLNDNGQLDVPDVPGGFVTVDAAALATCGIDPAGDVHCWTTLELFPTDGPVSGPFVQIDIDSSQGCGLTASGDIECFAASETLNLSAPTNGPYIDLTVTSSAICGLRSDQLLDCTFASPSNFSIDPLVEEYPLDVAFSSIERVAIQQSVEGICGIRTDSGTISCFGGLTTTAGDLPPPPGAGTPGNVPTAANIRLSLTAEVYGPNQVELFWNQVPNLFPEVFVEVFRDDELLTTTGNSFSFFDNDSSVTSEESSYRVRTVDLIGNVGEFSNTIIANRLTRNVDLGIVGSDADNPRTDDVLLIQDLSLIAFDQFNSNDDSFILSWSVDDSSTIEVAGFEIRIDNVPVAFVSGLIFTGEGANLDQCSTYSVSAIAGDGEILDFVSLALGDNTFSCRSAR